LKNVKFTAVCFAALLVGAASLVGQAAADTTHIKITNEGPGDLTVSSSAISPPEVLSTGDQIETNVSTNIIATVTAGDNASNFRVRNFGPHAVLVTNGFSTIGVTPGFGLGVDVAANESFTISENP
jgi:hypothetical protein